MIRKVWAWMGELPSIVWIFLIVGGIAALIGGIIALFWALATIEGVASVLMLLVAWGVIRLTSDDTVVTVTQDAQARRGTNIFIAVGIAFFALMGVAVDQPGNYFYNQPIGWLFCPNDTHLARGVDVTHPLPGRTDVTQNFACVTDKGQPAGNSIGVEKVIAVRFGEYVLLGYVLIWLNRLYGRLRRRRLEVPQAVPE